MPKEVRPGHKRHDTEGRAQRVFEHRRSGGTINRKFAAELALEGYTDPSGFPLTTRTLQSDYKKAVDAQQIFHRDTYDSFDTLQLMRLEKNIEILNKYLEPFNDEAEGGGGPTMEDLTPQKVYAITALAKEVRQTIDSISKLAGLNAATEVVVTQRFESEIQIMIGILKSGLEPAIFQQVSACLAKGLNMTKERNKVVSDTLTIPGYEVLDEDEGDMRNMVVG